MGPGALLLLVSVMLRSLSEASLTTIIGELNGQTVLPCSTVAENATSVAWFLENSEQKVLDCDRSSSSDSRFLRVNGSTLVITSLRMEDGGNYGCKDCAQLQAAPAQPHIQLSITSGPQNVSFQILPSNILPNGTLYTLAGSNLNVSCFTQSIPQAKMDVTLNTQNKSPELFHSVVGAYLNFTLFNIGADYEGNYTCVAKNHLSQKTVSSVLELLVYHPPTFPMHCSANNTGAPSELSVKCHWPEGHPPPILQWEVDGKILSNETSDTLETLLNGSLFNDKQTLTCRGRYLIGETTKEEACQVYLGYPVPQSQPLRTCLIGENVTLSCTVSGANPLATIAWLRNLSTPDVVIQPGKKYQITQAGNTSYLTIVNCSHEGDEGYYICMGMNAVATKDLYIWVEVNKPHNIVGLVSALLILFLLVVGLITGIILYCDPQVYLKANPFRSGQSDVLILVDSEDEEEMEQMGGPVENGHYTDNPTSNQNPPAANGNIYKHQVLFHHPPENVSHDLASEEVSEDTEAENVGDQL
ncbi:V-set and immunoglobulin domain-containing protein 10 [Hyperolius riggenbachi]|uniref:V-set and immunoglobulin domain-containing protein 10 n=1 Tax=Hyperolius riggenbachi TaxID=752182 RepID=UPI0035A367E6